MTVRYVIKGGFEVSKLIYLAGAMSVYNDSTDNYLENAIRWRLDFINSLRKECSGEVNFWVYDPTKFVHNDKDSVYANNLYYLKRTDILVVNSKDLHESPGTLWEIFIADSLDIPIIFIGNHIWFNRPHLERVAKTVFKDIDLAVKYIMDRYVELTI